MEAALLEDAVHLFGLLGCEGEPLDDHGVLPPHAGGSHAEFAALAAAEVVAVTHHLRTAEALLHAWLHIALRHAGAHPLTHAGIRRRLALDGCGRRGWSGGGRRSGRRLLGECDGGGETESNQGKHGIAN